MNPSNRHRLAGASVLASVLVSAAALAQQAPKPEQLIKWRQSAYQVLAWNNGRIRANVEGNYNKEEVVKAATVIAAVANSGLGSLFPASTEVGKGWHDTTVKPALFTDGPKVAELSAALSKEANELLRVAQAGTQAEVKAQAAALNKACKSCHDDYRSAN